MNTDLDQRVRFTAFVEETEPRLRRALTSLRGPDAGLDATAEALAWAWEHWDQVKAMENPAGYLYRVGVSRTRPRARPLLPRPESSRTAAFEPGLSAALASLSERQRSVVVLIHGCGWTHYEVAEALNVSKGTVGTHLRRALAHLRTHLKVESHE